MNIRVATPSDAAAIKAICAAFVANTSISFELTPPTVEEMRGRVDKTLADLPWLLSVDAQVRCRTDSRLRKAQIDQADGAWRQGMP